MNKKVIVVPDLLEAKLKQLEEADERGENEQRKRKLISDLLSYLEESEGTVREFDDFAKMQNAQKLCLKKLRKLNNISEASAKTCSLYSCDLYELLESVSLCADILLADNDYNLRFSGERVVCSFNPEYIIDAFLNLISNGVKFSRTGEVKASLSKTENQAVIRVENEAFFNEPLDYREGIESVRNVCFIHSGRLLFSQTKDKFSATMSLDLTLPSEDVFTPPAFSRFLADRYSPVYVGLSEVL